VSTGSFSPSRELIRPVGEGGGTLGERMPEGGGGGEEGEWSSGVMGGVMRGLEASSGLPSGSLPASPSPLSVMPLGELSEGEAKVGEGRVGDIREAEVADPLRLAVGVFSFSLCFSSSSFSFCKERVSERK
jgi:hypothetical protein